MAAGSLVSIHEYLNTCYRPDCDYVDGVVLERHVGMFNHSYLLGELAVYYRSHRGDWKVESLVSQRIQVLPYRVRVPDVTVVAIGPYEQVLRTPPLACIEVLAREDRFGEMIDRFHDYLSFGVPYVWIIDPSTRKAWRCTATGMHEVAELRTENPETLVPLAELFD